MTRRVIVSFDDVITAIAEQMPTALRDAAVTLFSAGGKDIGNLVDAFYGDPAPFAHLASVNATPTQVMVLRMVASGSQAFSTVSLSVHELDTRPGEARLVARTNLMSPKVADHAFEALQTIHDGTRDEDDALRIMHAKIQATTGDRLRHYGESSREKAAAKIMDELRDEQQLFGPPEGHALHLVPDYETGMSQAQLLESLPDRALERVRELVTEMGMTGPRP